jgi:hypothetical protein
MPYVLLQHTVANYEEFKAIYDADTRYRKRRGSHGGRLFRSTDDPNFLVMLFEWDTLEKAHRFATSAELEDAMRFASATGDWKLTVLEEIEQDEA